ncbi:MAG: hypothetical protein LBS82_05045, partial [Spirochaetaceae bacterium]|nr:hypothetical protein [Spirochaetaceae bacterium]
MSDDWIPNREQDLVDLLVFWDEALGNSEKRAAYGWSAPDCGAIVIKIAKFLEARTEYHNNKTKGNRLDKDAKKAILVAAMRDFANTSIRWNKKIPIQDRLNLGVGLKDETDTPQG